MLSDKYICGLLDSDGCISVQYCKSGDTHYAYARLSFYESPNKSNGIPAIQEAIEGTILERVQTNNVGTFSTRELRFTGAKAVSTLRRLQRHVVTKQGLLELVCSINGTKVLREENKSKVKELRATGQVYPQYPSRKYLAGWLDGNGSLTGSLQKSGVFYPWLSATAWLPDRGVLELIVKQFGGAIHPCKGEQAVQLYLYLGDPSKCIEVLEYLEHVVILKPRRDWLLSLARSGSFRDGKPLLDHLKTLRGPAAETK